MLEVIKLQMETESLDIFVCAIGVSAPDLILPKLQSLSLCAHSNPSETWTHIYDFLNDRATKMDSLGITGRPLYQLRTYHLGECSKRMRRKLSAWVHEIEIDFSDSQWVSKIPNYVFRSLIPHKSCSDP